MPRWLPFSRALCISRWYSSRASTQHVHVSCASSGHITVSLHNVNISERHAAAPLVIVIPPLSQARPDPVPALPPCLHGHPTAVINYRWQARSEHDPPEVPLHWPTPIHDVLFGYSWLSANLGAPDGDPEPTKPRSAYVYGSYLGASLAAGLALTESHLPDPSRRMTIRGLIAHNGIYNWTTLLPDHPIHKPRPRAASKRKQGGLLLPLPPIDETPTPSEEEGIFTFLKHQTPALFSDPANLFDPFASACLFFHSANLHVPDDFATPLSTSSPLSPEWIEAIDLLSASSLPSPIAAAQQTETSPDHPGNSDSTDSEREPAEPSADDLLAKAAMLAKQARPPRKGYLLFPPRHSTLRLPDTLLLYDRPRPLAGWGRRKAAAGVSRNNFKVQATDLAGLMRRSLVMGEFRQRVAGGEEEWMDEEAMGREVERRVQTWEVGPRVWEVEEEEEIVSDRSRKELMELDEKGEEVVAEWLQERIDEEGI